jgi:acetyl-CoA C-acetyltransferase
MIFRAAVRAYADARVEPAAIDSFVGCAEDLLEGTSIFDEYTPDQLGAVQRPVHTVCADGLYGIAAAAMQIRTGRFDRVAVEAHSKASNILTLPRILHYAVDPVFNRPLGLHPYYLAGMEMRRYLRESRLRSRHCALVVQKNRTHALRHPHGTYASASGGSDVPLCDPLTESDVAPHADGAVVVVLAAEGRFSRSARPVWLRGIGWCSDTPTLETRPWGRAVYLERAAEAAYRQAGIRRPARQVDFAEIDDTFSYKELQHLEALGLSSVGRTASALERGVFSMDGKLPVNVSGGSLGCGHLLEGAGLFRLAEAAGQLRGEAGPRQLKKARTAVVASWRGVPTTSGAVAVLSSKRGR